MHLFRTLALLAALPLRAQPADVPSWLKAIEAVNRSILKVGVEPPPGLAKALLPRIPSLSAPGRVLAARVLALAKSSEAASLLLQLVKDPNASVAAAAATGLRDSASSPPAADLLRVIPSVESPSLRAQLFLAAGKAKTPLPTLRELLNAESDARARPSALAAAIRLGGVPERAAFAAEVATAKGPAVVPLMKLLVYTGDKSMAFVLLPMFGSNEAVIRISPDPESRMASRSDLAVWTAHELGLIPSLRVSGLRRFDAQTTAAARAACASAK